MHAIVAMLHVVAIAMMLLTRLYRSAIQATGMPNTATVTETTDTRAPNCQSVSIQSLFRNGNIEAMICRSM